MDLNPFCEICHLETNKLFDYPFKNLPYGGQFSRICGRCLAKIAEKEENYLNWQISALHLAQGFHTMCTEHKTRNLQHVVDLLASQSIESFLPAENAGEVALQVLIYLRNIARYTRGEKV